jgi:hypothetical protein
MKTKILLALLLAIPALRADVPPWVRDAARQTLPAYPDAPGGVQLVDETFVQVNDRGEISTTHREAFRILSTAGRKLGVASVYFDNETKLRDFHAWSIAANGTEYTVKERDAYEASAFDGEIYSDHKLKALTIPAADPGSVVAFEYEQRQRPYDLHGTWYFQTMVPVRSSRYSVSLPQGWTYEAHWHNAAPMAPQGDALHPTWSVSEVPALKSEPGMPAMHGVMSRLTINFFSPDAAMKSKTRASWSDVGSWFTQLASPRRVPSPEMQAKTRELTASSKSTWDKVRALAGFAQRDIRYVAIEIGIGGYQPHAASDVFRNRYGDCKDKATMLGTMLTDIGVTSYPLLVNTSRGVVAKEFASIASFDHAIIAIKVPDDAPKDLPAAVQHPTLGRLLLFDPTNDTVPIGLLPTYLQDNRGLLVAGSGGELLEMPLMPSKASRLTIGATLALSTEGTLSGDVREVRSGWIGSAMRGYLRGETDAARVKFLEQRLGYSLSQASISKMVIENLDDLDKELVITYHLVATSYAKKAGNLLLVRPRLLGRKADVVLDLKERKYPYELDAPSLENDTIEITLPAGLVMDELPPPAKVTSGPLRYASETKIDNGVMTYKREYEVQAIQVALDKLPELNGALTKILADERNAAVFKLQ